VSDESSEAAPKLKIRIEALSDLIFGLALSIGSITLVLNITNLSQGQIETNILVFGFGFFILISTWLGYSRTAAVLALDSSVALLLNLLLLFTVALEPYLLYILFFVNQSSSSFADFSSTLYALDIGVMFVILGSLALTVVRERREFFQISQLHPATKARFRRAMVAHYIAGTAYLISALPFFWIPLPPPIGAVRFIFWYSAFVYAATPRFRTAKLIKEKSS
jgi:hypothetical protein